MAKHYGNITISDTLTTQGLIVNNSTQGLVLFSENNEWIVSVNDSGGLSTDDGTFQRSHTFGLYTQIVSSENVTATTTETTILGTAGIGSLIVPSDVFLPGDSFHCKIGGEISSGNGETIQMKVKSGSEILGDTGLITLPTITSKFWEAEIDFIVRANGTSGQASIVTNGQFVYNENAQNTYSGSGFNTTNDTGFNTTISNILEITVQWGSSNASNNIHSDLVLLTKTF